VSERFTFLDQNTDAGRWKRELNLRFFSHHSWQILIFAGLAAITTKFNRERAELPKYRIEARQTLRPYCADAAL
jgi:hypothetical protein